MAVILITAAAGAATGFALGLGLCWAGARRMRKRNRELRARLRREAGPVKPETMKRVVWACVTNGFAWVWCSYILAALDKPQIAEELSKVALAEIVVPVAVYALKSGLENLSKNNSWPDKGGEPDAGPEDQAPPAAG